MLWYVLISSCVILDVINVYWFYRISQGAVKLISINGRINYSIITTSIIAYLYYTDDWNDKKEWCRNSLNYRNMYNNNVYNNKKVYNNTNNNTYNPSNNANNVYNNDLSGNSNSKCNVFKLASTRASSATYNNNNSTLQQNYEHFKSR